jgi:NADPH:quinone reductase-like Zn-dependent oxidoreductase
MEQIRIPKTGDPSVLEIRSAPDPVPSPGPGPGEVRIQVDAAGVNFSDLMARMGLYPDAPPFPAVVGYEVAGSIDSVGEGVPASRIGEPVITLTRFGGYSSAVLVQSFQAVARPENMDPITGAAIPVTGLTAWMMLEIMGGLNEGSRVLVHSAGGGVGLAALDLLKWRGAVAVGTALGVNTGPLWDEGERITGWMQSLLALWSEGKLNPMIHSTVPYTDAAEAHRVLHDRKNLGKVILSFKELR